jgi:hypothetical protein
MLHPMHQNHGTPRRKKRKKRKRKRNRILNQNLKYKRIPLREKTKNKTTPKNVKEK